MIPVEQAVTYDEATGRRGDCVAACVASIFELTVEEVSAALPEGATLTQLSEWTRAHRPDLRVHACDFTRNHRIVDEGPPQVWAYDYPDPADVPPAPTDEHWIATVVSGRPVRDLGPFRGMRLLHAVVMLGDELAWDPHPQREMGFGQLTGQTWWESSP